MSNQATVSSRRVRPNHSLNFKRRLAQQACQAGVSVSRLAHEQGINANMLFKWRRHYRQGLLDELVKVAPLRPVSNVPPSSPPPAAPAQSAAPVSVPDPAGTEIVFEGGTVRVAAPYT